MLKSLHRKNIICFAVCAAAILSFSSCSVMSDVFSELGSSQETGMPQSADADPVNAETEAGTDETSEESQETTEEPTDEAGGNPEEGDSFSIEITVLEDKYIYDNHEISYDELIEIFDSLTEADVVQIRDENASLDAYRKVQSALEEREISYIDAIADTPVQ